LASGAAVCKLDHIVDALIPSLDEKIIQPAEARFVELLKRKADTMEGEHV
jgi:hypothetical protein